jgi:hypothetical protein
MRKPGMVVDNLRSVDLVTADGTCLTVSETTTRTCSGACAEPVRTSAS